MQFLFFNIIRLWHYIYLIIFSFNLIVSIILLILVQPINYEHYFNQFNNKNWKSNIIIVNKIENINIGWENLIWCNCNLLFILS